MAAPLPRTTPPDSGSWLACRGWFSDVAHDEPCWLHLLDGRIAAIRDQPPAGVPVPEPELYAVPLLADTHVHVYMEPWPVAPDQRRRPGSEPFEREVELALARVDHALAEGVGLLRDMGDPHGINVGVKRRLAARRLPAPELQVAGTGFHRPRSYGRFLGVARASVDEILAGIDALHAAGGIDFVKVVTTGIVDFAARRMNQPPQYTEAELRRVVDHAHALGYRVASHCSGADGLDLNLAAGVDFIEHAYFVRDDQIEAMAAQGACWTPTFAPVRAQGEHPDAGWDEPSRDSIGAILAEHARAFAVGAARGVRVLAGTDAGSPGVSMGAGLRLELSSLVGAGLTPAQALRLATVGAAEALRPRAYAPRLEIGAPASFALYSRCPWHDIHHLDSLCQVLHHGIPVPQPAATALTP